MPSGADPFLTEDALQECQLLSIYHDALHHRVRAVTAEELVTPEGKQAYLRVHLEVRQGAYVVTPVSGAGSHLMAGMARANALAVVPVGVRRIAAGGAVDVLVLERRGR